MLLHAAQGLLIYPALVCDHYLKALACTPVSSSPQLLSTAVHTFWDADDATDKMILELLTEGLGTDLGK